MTFLPSYVNGHWWAPEGDPDAAIVRDASTGVRSEEHTSELQSHRSISYAVFCLDRKSVV